VDEEIIETIKGLSGRLQLCKTACLHLMGLSIAHPQIVALVETAIVGISSIQMGAAISADREGLAERMEQFLHGFVFSAALEHEDATTTQREGTLRFPQHHWEHIAGLLEHFEQLAEFQMELEAAAGLL
jgi:hypothetical protein